MLKATSSHFDFQSYGSRYLQNHVRLLIWLAVMPAARPCGSHSVSRRKLRAQAGRGSRGRGQ